MRERWSRSGAVDAVFFNKIMDLSLPIFTLFSSEPFCMECIEFTTRTYNFKNLAVAKDEMSPALARDTSWKDTS